MILMSYEKELCIKQIPAGERAWSTWFAQASVFLVEAQAQTRSHPVQALGWRGRDGIVHD